MSSDFPQIQTRGRYYGFEQFLKIFFHFGKNSGFYGIFKFDIFYQFFGTMALTPTFSLPKILMRLLEMDFLLKVVVFMAYFRFWPKRVPLKESSWLEIIDQNHLFKRLY